MRGKVCDPCTTGAKGILAMLALLLATVALLLPAAIPQSAHAAEENYLTFSSSQSFTLKTKDEAKHWDGDMYYYTQRAGTNAWSGETQKADTIPGSSRYVLRVYGSDNTTITGSSSYGSWVLEGTAPITCSGSVGGC